MSRIWRRCFPNATREVILITPQLTPDERSFTNYASALADWLEPYHDHARPPPAVVLAEASKMAEAKTGYPLKGVEVPKNGNTTPTNGSAKKDEEAPPVVDAPELVGQFFDGMEYHCMCYLFG
jgi:N-terminal acetyltransferase B complex non-catalytic subunit